MGGVSCSETLADRSPVTAKAVHSESNQADFKALLAEKDEIIRKLELQVSKMETSCKDDYDDDDEEEELKGGERYRMTAEESRRWWEDAKSSMFNIRYWNALLRTVWQVDYPRVLRQFAQVTKNSKAVNAVDRKAHASYKHVFGVRVLASNKEISYPITALDADGAYFWDVDGNKYLDCCCSWGSTFYGHRDPYVDGAIKQALDSGYQTALHAADSGEAAILLCELTGNDRVGFQSSGSEACMCAIKVARAYTCKNKILTFNLHYHGWFDPFLHHNVSKKLKDHNTGEEGKGQDHIRNYFNTLPEGSSAPIYTGIPDDTDVLVLDLDEAVGDFIRRHKDELACVILEPVTGKTALPKPHLLKMLREACTETGVVLIFDEVFIGFRCHVGGAQKYFGIQADMATYGKVIGGGFGIGAVAGKAKIMEYLDGGVWSFGDTSLPAANRTYIGGTHAGHPVVMSACAAIMRKFKERGNKDHEILNDRVNQVANELRTFLDQDKRLNPVVNNFGSFLCFSNSSFRIDEMKQTFEHVMVLRGMYFPTALGMLRLLFCCQHKDFEMKMLVDVFKQTYKDMFATVGTPWCLERPKVLADDARVEVAEAYMKRRGIKPTNFEIPNPIPRLANVEPEYVGTYVEETRNLIRSLVPAKAVTTVQAAFKQPVLSGSWTTILLAGATGFVGRHVLQQILTTTNYKVIAIIRELNGVEAQSRLDDALSQAGIELTDDQKARIRVVPGDLEQENFGIGVERCKELARQVEAVFNCASYTGPGNWQEGKKTLHIAVNLAKFCYPLIWLVHYSSYVQDFRYNDRFSRVAGALYYFTYVLDPKDIDQKDGFSMGKWAADELIGVVDHFTPCITVRIGQPWASKTGYIDPKSYYARFFQACAKTGSIPNDQHLFEVSPVDSVAEVSVRLVIEEASKPITSSVVFVTADSPVMYVCQMEGIKNKHVKEIAKKNGINLKSVPYDSWKQSAKSAVPWDQGFDDYVDRQHHMFRKKVQWRNKYLPIIQYPYETPGFPDPKEAFSEGLIKLKANGFLQIN